MAPTDPFGRSAWMLASIAVVVAALYLAKGVLVPMTLAVLLSFLLSPVCDWFERRRLGRIPAVVVTAIMGFTILGLGIWTTVVQVIDLAPRMPEYQSNLQAKLNSANVYLSAMLNKVARTARDVGDSLPSSPLSDEERGNEERPYVVRVLSSPTSPLAVIGGMYATLLEVMGSTGIVILLVVFFLIRRDDLRDRFIRLVGQGQLTVTTDALADAGTRVSRYLATQFLINVIFGVPVAIGLLLIGVPNAILWGILALILRFIPYIGPLIAAAMPIALSMAISTNWVAPILTTVLFVVLELIISNVIEPWLYGKHTGVSPVAVVVAAVFWTWLWGAVGLLLATPLTVCLLVIGKHVPQLSFLNVLLGDEPVFEPRMRVYQRLLSGDQEEAAELVDSCLEGKSLVEVYDALLIPVLGLAEADRRRGEIDDGRQRYIFQSLRDTVDDLGERQRDSPTEPQGNLELPLSRQNPAVLADRARPTILCLPARNEADEIVIMMLAHALEISGHCVETVSLTALAGEIVELVEERVADVVCISAMPPAAATHARYLCKRLRGRFPDAHLVVGLWNAKGDLEKARKRIGCSASVRIVGTLAQAQEQIRLALQSPLMRQAKPELEGTAVPAGHP
jgi:predicted PurR-regulated permease PerM/methylmalonyl-CoA mutase cobalamin-binding subunit